MKRVIIESRYAGDIEANLRFARLSCLYALSAGFSPYASHQFFPQMLNDDLPAERAIGIKAGLAWSDVLAPDDEVWFCIPQAQAQYGQEAFSSGMLLGLDRHALHGPPDGLGGRMLFLVVLTDSGRLISKTPICVKAQEAEVVDLAERQRWLHESFAKAEQANPRWDGS